MLKRISSFFRWLLILFLGSSIGAVVAFRYLPVPCSPLMLIRLFEQVKRGEQMRLKHCWVPLDSISPDLPLAVWASEDQRFFEHSGFDLEEIRNARMEAERGGRRRGASTISQQTAKNLFLWPDASWLRKGLEAYFTVLIEVCWDKHRIMEVYLNTIEMGDGIYGAEAVAREHFGCSARVLSRSQCALIAASLPNPLRYDSAHPSSFMYRRQSWILRQMRNLQKFPVKEVRDSKDFKDSQ